MSDDHMLAEARKRAKMKYDFYVHLIVYLVVIGALFIVNQLTNSTYLWVIWPALGWGSALLIHGVSAFLLSSNKNTIIDELTRRELDKQNKKQL